MENKFTYIKWYGRSTSGISKWTVYADSITDLMNQLFDKNLIHYDDYDDEILKKAGKSRDDFEDYDEIQKVVDNVILTDEENVTFILEQKGNAYYQHFYVQSESGEWLEDDIEVQVDWNNGTYIEL
ncbi:hypothetical protein NHG29_01935 [Aerococcaceae bacterium NML160702]|nr:hypothetical protein [Aerococcaceae bacterium NML160702]